MTHSATQDWRAAYRLNALDVECSRGRKPHWMLQASTLNNWIMTLSGDYERAVAAGADPLNGRAIAPEAMIDQLGFSDRQKPTGFFATARFTAAMVAAATRESARIELAIAAARHGARRR